MCILRTHLRKITLRARCVACVALIADYCFVRIPNHSDEMKSTFQRLVRFRSEDGRTLYGEAPFTGDLVGSTVPVYAGDNPWDLQRTDQTAKVKKVRGVVTF